MINDLKKELSKIRYKEELLNDLLESLFKNKCTNGSILNSKVLITHKNGLKEEGRTIKYNSNKLAWDVKIDGNSGTTSISQERLEIKYPGPEGLIDKMLWQIKCRQEEIEKIIMGSDLPYEIIDKDIINIKVVETYKSIEEYSFIDFEIFGMDKVFRTKMHHAFAKTGKFLQLKIFNGDIVEIHTVSKEKYYNKEQ